MRDFETGLSQERLQSVLRYEPETGHWFWLARATPWSRITVGARAGGFCAKGYVLICVGGFQYKAHRLAHFYMTGKWPPHTIDHEDLGKGNNKWSNLRPATRQQNNRNTPVQRNSTTGLKGVSFDARKQMYRAQIYIQKKQIWLGYHATAESASAAYLKAQREHFGEFARAA